MARSLSNSRKTGISKLYTLRRELKIELFQSRRKEAWKKPTCAVCRKEIKVQDGADMHEVFLTRGDAMGISNEDDRRKIYDKHNCVLVHHGECHLEAATETGKIKCAIQLIEYEGLDNLLEYIDSMAKIFKSLQPAQEYMFLRLVAHGVNRDTHQVLVEQMYGQPEWNF